MTFNQKLRNLWYICRFVLGFTPRFVGVEDFDSGVLVTYYFFSLLFFACSDFRCCLSSNSTTLSSSLHFYNVLILAFLLSLVILAATYLLFSYFFGLAVAYLFRRLFVCSSLSFLILSTPCCCMSCNRIFLCTSLLFFNRVSSGCCLSLNRIVLHFYFWLAAILADASIQTV